MCARLQPLIERGRGKHMKVEGRRQTECSGKFTTDMSLPAALEQERVDAQTGIEKGEKEAEKLQKLVEHWKRVSHKKSESYVTQLETVMEEIGRHKEIAGGIDVRFDEQQKKHAKAARKASRGMPIVPPSHTHTISHSHSEGHQGGWCRRARQVINRRGSIKVA